MGVHSAAMHFGGPFGQLLHHLPLMLGGFGCDGMIFNLRGGQMELVGGFHISDFLEEDH